MIIQSQHRSLALALRHLSALSRKYDSAELLSRRNARGEYSRRGQFYVFEVETKKKKKRTEYVVHFDYGSVSKQKGKRLVRFQVHVFGPCSSKADDVIDAIREFNSSEEWPRGWSHKTIFWGHPRNEDEDACVWRKDPISEELREAAIDGGTAKLANHCRTSRRKVRE